MACNFLRWWYVILSSPGEELDDLFASTLFILPGVIAERSKSVISSKSGDGITSSIHFGKMLVFRSILLGAVAIGAGCKIFASFRYTKIGFYIDIETSLSIFSEIPRVFSKRSLLELQVLGAVIRSLCGEALVMCPKGIEKLARVRLPRLTEAFLYKF